MDEVSGIGVDTSKRIFQLHGVDRAERVVLRRQLRRSQMAEFFARLPPTKVAMEACGASHHWARELRGLGPDVVLIAPQHAKPYVKRGKNDAADAAALCEAMSRPTMRFVPVKTAEQQAALMLANMRERLVRSRTRLANTARGHAAEFGLVAPTGPAQLSPLLARAASDPSVPALARQLFAELAAEDAELEQRLRRIDAELKTWFESQPVCRLLAEIPGVGPVIASMLVMKTPDPHAFRCGRDFAAWIGLTPRDHSTAGRMRLGVITRAGDETLRSLLVVGATSVVNRARRPGARPIPWLARMLARKKAPKLVAVALANRIARIAWKLMTTGEAYDPARRDAHRLSAPAAAA